MSLWCHYNESEDQKKENLSEYLGEASGEEVSRIAFYFMKREVHLFAFALRSNDSFLLYEVAF